MGQARRRAADALRAIAPIRRHDHRLPRRRPGDRCATSRLRMNARRLHDGEIDRYEIELYSSRSPRPLKALLVVDERGHATIYLTIESDAGPAGGRAAVCDDDGVQIGIVEIEL